MGTLRRTLSAVITAAILLGAVVLVIILSRAAPAAPGEGVASAPQVTPAGYPAPPEPPEADAPPSPRQSRSPPTPCLPSCRRPTP